MDHTFLKLNDSLPLTCSREGTCCHGNRVLMNPFEIACLASESGISAAAFRNAYCEWGGVRLRFDGKADIQGKKACCLYTDGLGCSVHPGRPLVCRLYPLGRMLQSDQVQYVYEGNQLPCITKCPAVEALPSLSVEAYLAGQQTVSFELAHDLYLSLMQSIADIAFSLLLDTGLAQQADMNTLGRWRESADKSPEQLAQLIDARWIAVLLVPELDVAGRDPEQFVNAHTQLIQDHVQQLMDTCSTHHDFHLACVLMMNLALMLAHALNIHSSELAERWIGIALENGATL